MKKFLLSASFSVLLSITASAVIPQPCSYSPAEGVNPCTEPLFAKSRNGKPDSYTLTVTPEKIVIRASTPGGRFYALQTLEQLKTSDAAGRTVIPCCSIEDAPAYPYRGLMIDVSRHFRSVEFIKKQLDAMALLKLNVFHFHLVDAVGWRLQLDGYPELTQQCSFRREVEWIGDPKLLPVPEDYVPGTVYDKPECYGGYYTKAQIREIIDYAAQRCITVIPEIEMPGHSSELAVVHPEIFCTVPDTLVKSASVCPGKEETYRFFTGVLEEVMELFPSRYIHIGGDEAGKEYWSRCLDCRRMMEENGLQSVEELQSFFIRRIDKFVSSRGRRIIGWDEIMQGGLSEGATVMSWRGTEGGLKAIEMGHDVIMTPTAYCYLDYFQGAPQFEPKAIGGYVPLSKTYSFAMLSNPHLLGVQGNLWSEYIVKDEHYEYMLYPRVFAIAELGWTPEGRRTDYADFRQRALELCRTLNSRGYTTFDLENEIISDQDVPGSGKSKVLSSGCSSTIEGERVPWNYSIQRLTDNDLRAYLYFKGPSSVTVDLGRECDIHTVCPYFVRNRGSRESALPSSVSVSVSADGVAFRHIAATAPMADDGPLSWAAVPVPVFCNERAVRYVRVEFTPSATCPALDRVRRDATVSAAEATPSNTREAFERFVPISGEHPAITALAEIVVN